MTDEAERIRSAIHFIPAADRDTWVKMGMAIKSELGDAGFPIWNSWSESDESFDVTDAKDVWKSINSNGKVTIGTLFHEAKAHGWRDEGIHPKPTPQAIAQRQRSAQERAAKDEAEEIKREAEAREKAMLLWAEAQPCARHAYLTRKGIGPHGTRLLGADLVILLHDTEGVTHSIQTITPNGEKRFMAGGRVKGCYFSVGTLKGAKALCICEGLATAASINEATGHPVAVAFSAGNLKAVATAFREKFPGLALIVCADDDYRTEGNPGLSKATEAARAVGAKLAIPAFGEGSSEDATDFNDMHQRYGLEAVQRAVASATEPVEPHHGQAVNGSAVGAEAASHIAYRRVSDIQAKPIHWLWESRIARGKVSMIAGNPGLGKSQVTASMAAIVSIGGLWPVDRTRCESGNVVILSAEDDAEDTIRPRLEAAGADLTRVFILDAVVECLNAEGGEVRRAFNLKADLKRLSTLLHKIGGVALIVIDPVTAYLGETDSHKNADVRALLAPLADLAAAHSAAIVCVSHLNKNVSGEALMRVTGSLAFVAASRAAFLIAKDQENEERRLFLPLKNNIGNDRSGLAFAIHAARVQSAAGAIETSRIVWDADAVSITADAAMVAPDKPEERSAIDDAKEFLQGLLTGNPVSAKRVYAEAREAGHAEITIRRAKKALGVEAIKGGMNSGWVWSLPPKVINECEEARDNCVNPFGNVDHLQQPSDDDGEIIEGEI